MTSNPNPVALVTGGSAGLGFRIAEAFCQQNYRVVIAGRTESKLRAAADQLIRLTGAEVTIQRVDLTDREQVDEMIATVDENQSRLDVLVNCAGKSHRGLIQDLDPLELQELLQQNILTTLNGCQASLELLERSGGVIVNIGSLASKVSPRFLGGYAIAKHGLAALTGQLRLELQPRGIHVALISPGPIRRDDEGSRYDDQVGNNLPQQAKKPGGGARIRGLPPEKVARAVLRCVERRKTDVILPGYLRLLIVIGHAFPRLGDWLLLKFTSSRG